MPFLFTYLPGMIIDDLFVNYNIRSALTKILILVIGTLVVSIGKAFINASIEAKRLYIDNQLSFALSSVSANTDYSLLETTSFLETYQKHISGINRSSSIGTTIQKGFQVLENVASIIVYTILIIRFSFIGRNNLSVNNLVTFIAAYSWIFFLFIVILSFLLIMIRRRNNEQYLSKLDVFIPSDRKYSYYQKLSRNETCLKDIRLYPFFSLLSDYITEYKEEAKKLEDALYHIRLGQNICVSFLMVCERILIYIVAGCKVVTSLISYGQFYIYINAVRQILKSFEATLEILENIRYALRFHQSFQVLSEMDTSDDNKVDCPHSFETLRFDNVWFKYPGSSNYILKGVSFTINKGDKACLVGLNGAGKSTIVKLICAFYYPDQGSIFINGVDIRDYNKHKYQHWINVLFQETHCWAGTIEENIVFKENDPRSEKLIHSVGLDYLCSRHQGVSTQVTRIFDSDGVVLSGGELQRVGLARSEAEIKEFILFDEPTASLDPLGEQEIYGVMNTLFSSKTVLTISHRLYMTKDANQIFVLNDGMIVEQGTHEELLREKGLYSKIWEAQSETYIGI